MKSLFSKRILQIIRLIPHGKVMSYGQVATYAGAPRAARQVGWILNKTQDDTIPWWRVLNNSGRITIKGSAFSPETQAALLRSEGISVADDLTCDIQQHRHFLSKQELKDHQLPEDYLRLLYCKYKI